VSVGRLFHVAHITEDLSPLDAWYDRVFAPVRGIMDGHYAEGLRRMASMFVIGDAVIEVMSPSAEPEAASMPIGRFFAKFGRHWHSVAWYDDDIRSTWDRMVAHGIPVLQAGGHTDPPPDEGDIYTHPKGTFTQLEFYQPQVAVGGPQAPGPFADPRFAPGWTARWEASPNPLGITRMASVTIVVPDLERATTTYAEGIGATLLGTGASELTGTRSAYVSVGPETVIELAQPTQADSLAGRDLATYPGGTCHAMTFTVADLDQVAAHLGQVGVSVLGRDESTIVIDPADAFGAPFRFTTWRAPGDPRD
jgi:catechol 2,3-dioxygenase-like lactoylglutathione lyase family enzyme